MESSDCSVCLSEFQENERLRLLPECSHAFHVPCIDTWLKSHSNCPLCRAFVAGGTVESVVSAAASNRRISDSITTDHRRLSDGDSVVVDLDLETTGSRDEAVVDENGGSTPKPPELRGSRGGGDQVNPRSDAAVVLIADILREIEDEEEAAGVGTSRRGEDEEGEKTPPSSESAANQGTGGISNFLGRSSMAGKFVRTRNYRLPN